MRHVARTPGLFHLRSLRRHAPGACGEHAGSRASAHPRSISRMPLLFRDFDKRVEIRSPREGLIRLRRHDEAATYLKRLGTTPEILEALRTVLNQYHGMNVERLSDAQVLQEAVRHLQSGSLQLMEVFEPRLEAPSTIVAEPQEVAAVEVTPPPAPRALLPLLEALQIEGAEVLPEIMQTLAQIDVIIAGIGSATLSLEPAPSKIPDITATMDSFSADITDTLGSL